MSEPELPNLLTTWRGQPTRTEVQQLEARMTALQQLLDQVLNRPQPEFEPLRQSLDRLTQRLDCEPQLLRLEQTGKNAAELALALEATTRRLADLTAALHSQRLHHESRRRLLLWLPIAALAMSLAGNCLTVWLAWDSNQTIRAAWSWKGQVEDWANRIGQKVDSIASQSGAIRPQSGRPGSGPEVDQRLNPAPSTKPSPRPALK